MADFSKYTKKDLNVESASRSQRISKIAGNIITYIFLTIMAVIIIFPFYWMIISSLKTMEEYRANVPTLWPQNIYFENFATAFGKANLKDLFLHTLLVGTISTVLSLIVTVLSAFAFARLQFKGKNVVFGLLMATMMVPGELYTITNYLTVSGRLPFASESISALDFTNTFAVLIFPMLVSVFYIYLLRQTFMQIPNELYLAAKVDGTSDFKYLWKVMLPLSVSTIITITILKMMGAWNAYIWPRLVANDAAHQLITNGLRGASFTDEFGETNYPAQMAAVTIVSIPLFLIFVFLRKYIMRGVSRSGIKG
ncbi:MAG: carbohydrate ABC transporter permease [Clostridia bacterium]|nr:carbohydrate ABC transporter permease [Clostridia bacterium]